ncbi:oxidation resistance protein 1 [Tulasnella sp. 427]|nr:oxidation resistance protein 1 [Tulasnella sp. 427]
MVAFFPLVSRLAVWDAAITGGIPGIATKAGIAAMIVTKCAAGVVFAYVELELRCNMILVSQSAPSRTSLGAVNGVAQMVASSMRAVGPTLATILFAISTDPHYHALGGQLIWVYMLFLALFGVYASSKVQEGRIASPNGDANLTQMAPPSDIPFQPLIPLPQSSRDPSSRPITPPTHPIAAVPDSPFSSLFNPPPQGSTSSTKPLFPVTIEYASTPKATASNTTKGDPSESPSSTFGEFVSSDPLQGSQHMPAFSPIERSPFTAQRLGHGSAVPTQQSNGAEQQAPWMNGGSTTGGTFAQEAAARTKARADKVMGELVGRNAEDPLGWLSTGENRSSGGSQEPFDDWDGLDSVEPEVEEEKEREMLDEIADRKHLPRTPRASRSGSPVERSASRTTSSQKKPDYFGQDDSDDDIIDLQTGKRERPRGRPTTQTSNPSSSKAIPIRRPGTEQVPHPNQASSSVTSSSYLNFTLPRKWFSSAGPSPPQMSASNSVPKTGLTRQMSAGEFTELPHANLSQYGGGGAGGTISETSSPRASLTGLFDHTPVTPFAKKSFAPISGAPAFKPDDDWNPSGFEYDSKSKKDTLGNERLKLAGRYENTIPVLSGDVADMLRPNLPPLPRLAQTWTLLYSTDQHGMSISTLYKNVEKVYGMNGGCILAIREAVDEDGDGDIDANDIAQAKEARKSTPCFGVWVGTGIKCNEGSYYGSGESFLWKTVGPNPASHFGAPSGVKVFKWTGRNDYVALCESEYLSFGGGDGKYGLYVDSSFVDGTSERCETFANETLCGDHDMSGRARFECLALEVWRTSLSRSRPAAKAARLASVLPISTTTTSILRKSTFNELDSDMSTPEPRRRAPLFYCYECHTEARPLMVPDPHCPECNSTFVEEIPAETADATTNPDLDPRHFQVDLDPHDHGAAGFGDYFGPGTGGGDPIITLMNLLMARPLAQPQGRTLGTRLGGGFGGGFGGGGSTTLRFDMSNGQGRVIFQSGGSGSPLGGIIPGPAVGSPGSGSRSPPGGPRGEPTGLEGLLALLGGVPIMGGPGGQMGDYVLDQQALDEIVTRLMEQNQGARPVPAPDDIIEKLPRTKIVPGHALTEKECAVCKDTFAPPGPGEEDVIAATLPCSDNPKFQHSFHEDCIIPWLKQNGTCPVCRYQLVPQPEPHGPPPQTPNSEGGNGRPGPGSEGGMRGDRGTDSHSGSSGGSGIAQSLGGLWDLITGGNGSSSGSRGKHTDVLLILALRLLLQTFHINPEAIHPMTPSDLVHLVPIGHHGVSPQIANILHQDPGEKTWTESIVRHDDRVFTTNSTLISRA